MGGGQALHSKAHASPPACQFNGTFTAGHPGIVGADRSGRERYAQGAGEYRPAPGVTFIKGTAILLDPAGSLYAAIGAANLRAWVQGQDDRGGAALGN